MAHNYIDLHPFAISGNRDSLRRNLMRSKKKLDMLGFPIPHQCRLTTNPYFKLKKYSIDKIEISKDRKFAKVHKTFDGTGLFPPEFWRGIREIKVHEKQKNFWENIEGKWFVAVLEQEMSISGTRHPFFFVPADDELWTKLEFVVIMPDKFLPNKK